ncbi:hypothetical protein Cgig2_021009 [Carnegiea gigantea]|uniref:Uncharacterized protein n=1 Tax=Carnegiea gigantea TaxID=171969 RepID=A0A9Q1QEP9_9CARY|nr:hypothetical protein Cgig2_021009 [Carnegiea gigantea]
MKYIKSKAKAPSDVYLVRICKERVQCPRIRAFTILVLIEKFTRETYIKRGTTKAFFSQQLDGEVDSDKERWKKERVGGKRSAARATQRSNAGAKTAQKVGKDREKPVLELRKRRRPVANEAAPVSGSSSASDKEGSAFEGVDEGTDNSASSSSLSPEAEVSGSSGDVDMTACCDRSTHMRRVSTGLLVGGGKKREVLHP